MLDIRICSFLNMNKSQQWTKKLINEQQFVNTFFLPSFQYIILCIRYRNITPDPTYAWLTYQVKPFSLFTKYITNYVLFTSSKIKVVVMMTKTELVERCVLCSH